MKPVLHFPPKTTIGVIMRIAIIGAGISGLIAEGAFSKIPGSATTIFDPKHDSDPLSEHKAVMRLRDTRIIDYVNCKIDKVKVYKAVYHNGKLYDKPNLLLNNMYSLKVYDSLSERSLSTLGIVDRYTISNITRQGMSTRMVSVVHDIYDKQIHFDKTSSQQYDICISTIPMFKCLDLVGKSPDDYGVKFSWTPIFVTKMKLSIESDVHQTVYFTDQSEEVPYRITIEGNSVIAEAAFTFDIDSIYDCLRSAFGISYSEVDEESIMTSTQNMGKLEPISDDIRRKIMMDLTDEFNVYSFGRFATWRPLRIDQTLDDIEKIKMLVRIKHGRYYE